MDPDVMEGYNDLIGDMVALRIIAEQNGFEVKNRMALPSFEMTMTQDGHADNDGVKISGRLGDFTVLEDTTIEDEINRVKNDPDSGFKDQFAPFELTEEKLATASATTVSVLTETYNKHFRDLGGNIAGVAPDGTATSHDGGIARLNRIIQNDLKPVYMEANMLVSIENALGQDERYQRVVQAFSENNDSITNAAELKQQAKLAMSSPAGG